MKQVRYLGFLVIILGIGLMLITPKEGSAAWWDKFGKPKYGGVLNTRAVSLDAVSFDPSSPRGPSLAFWFETLFTHDWLLDRQTWAFDGGWTPEEYWKGLLADTWEQTDPVTLTIQLRKGIHWQDKPPVNGRELTATDVQYSFDRVLGTGSGFNRPNFFWGMMLPNIKKVTAKDKYTVAITYKEPGIFAINQVLGPIMGATPIIAREWVELGPPPPDEPPPGAGPPKGGPPKGEPPKGGPPVGETSPLQDWKNAVGTGPWVLAGYVQGSSMTFDRNPNYWGYDEHYPENRLPYLDAFKVFAIPDMATAIAGMRTGKIDMLTETSGLLWQQVETLLKTNPDIQTKIIPGPGASIDLRCDQQPFTDIRVRKALQMSIDLKAIAKTHYGGIVDGKPVDRIPAFYSGWTIPYDQWPAELQDEYTYNVPKAKELLKEAGYANGFKTNCVVGTREDVTLLEIIKSYFSEIGVDMEIRTMDPMSARSFMIAGKHDQMAMSMSTGNPGTPWECIMRRSMKDNQNYTHNNDAEYEALYEKLVSSSNMDEAMKLTREADMYSIKKHWSVNVCPKPIPFLWQPYVKGYSGELLMNLGGFYRARMWIDQDLKKSLGY